MRDNSPIHVCLKDKLTNKLIAVYPNPVEGTQQEIEKKVFDWYYAQGCSNENDLPRLFVSVLSEEELKNFH